MKNLVFIFYILIILFKTGNVLSNNNIFNVNNIKIDGKIYKNKEKVINQAFKKGYKELINRLLLEKDYQKLSTINLGQIKKLISYYQIVNPDSEEESKNKTEFNISFDKDNMYEFFYQNKILYSDIINTEIVLLPLFISDKEYFLYTKNYFYENWNNDTSDNLIQYTLPVESIESIQIIEKNKDNIYDLNFSDFFKEYDLENMAFVIIEINKDIAQIFLNTKITGKKLNKTLSINKANLNQKDFYNKIILETKYKIKNLIKSENLIDVRTPSFLNAEIKLNKKSNLIEFNNRIKGIGLIDNFHVQKLNKDYALVKIKFLGKIDKIINELKDQNINLKMIQGQWQIDII
tara:strand:- start:1068 stop:2111 length:1044 start_codon:yes stop_codon:yes gene_type:complete